jgi:soluble lytic murein transglycosylase-like protein
MLIEICAAALSLWTADAAEWYEPRLDGMMESCVEVAETAQAEGVDPLLAISLAWQESRLTPGRVSSVGAIGVMQIRPQYYCPDGEAEGCDTVLGGVRALGAKLERYDSEDAALCHYNCGNTCYEGGRQYARDIIARREELRDGLFVVYGWYSC